MGREDRRGARASDGGPRSRVFGATAFQRLKVVLALAGVVTATVVARWVPVDLVVVKAVECSHKHDAEWKEQLHFALSPFFTEAHWLLFFCVTLPLAVLALTTLRARLVQAAAELETLGAIKAGTEAPRIKKRLWPAVIIAPVVVMGFGLYSYWRFRQAPLPLESAHWWHGANWIQVVLVHGLEAAVTGWITWGVVLLNSSLFETQQSTLVLAPRDPLGRLGLFPLARVCDSMMSLAVALSAGVFVARVHSGGDVVAFVSEMASGPLEKVLSDGKWGLRWPTLGELPLLAFNVLALVAICWFPLYEVSRRRRSEMWWRIAMLRSVELEQDLVPTATARGWHDEAPNAAALKSLATAQQRPRKPNKPAKVLARNLRDELRLLQAATVWPNGAERGGPMLAMSGMLLLAGLAPVLLVPLVGLAVALGIASRVSGFLNAALSGQNPNSAATPASDDDEPEGAGGGAKAKE